MNWLDCSLLVIICLATVRGFMKGLILGLCGLVGLVLGIWGAIHFNGHIARWIGLEERHEALSFLVAVVLILAALHFLGLAITKLLDMAQLGLPNKLGGALLGGVRAVFLLSVFLNILLAEGNVGWVPSSDNRKGSVLVPPLRGFAPTIIPALGETQWVRKVLEDLERIQESD